MPFNDDDTSTDLHRGESDPPNDGGINDPLRYIERSIKHREQSVREVVLSATAICDGIFDIRTDSKLLARFVRGLADAKLISKAEAEKAELAKMPTISKIKKIHEHRDLICQSMIANRLCSGGFSVMYEFGLLIDDLPDESDKAAVLQTHLETLEGDMTRKSITDLRAKIAPKQARKSKKSAADTSSVSEEDDETDDETIEIVGDRGAPITAALLVVAMSDDFGVQQAALGDRWKLLAGNLTENSTVFVFAPMKMLLDIARAIKSFDVNVANVHLLSKADKHDVTKCDGLIICHHGEGVLPQGDWKPGSTPQEIVERYLDGVPGRRLHFFGGETPIGWEPLMAGLDSAPENAVPAST